MCLLAAPMTDVTIALEDLPAELLPPFADVHAPALVAICGALRTATFREGPVPRAQLQYRHIPPLFCIALCLSEPRGSEADLKYGWRDLA